MNIDMEDFTLDMLIAQAKAAQLKKETDAEKLPALFDKTLDALVSACEKLETITAERDQLATQVNALRTAALNAISFMSGGNEKAELRDAYDATPQQCLADIRAKAIRQFVSDTNETGQLSFPDCQWLEQWLDEWLDEAAKGGE